MKQILFHILSLFFHKESPRVRLYTSFDHTLYTSTGKVRKYLKRKKASVTGKYYICSDNRAFGY